MINLLSNRLKNTPQICSRNFSILLSKGSGVFGSLGTDNFDDKKIFSEVNISPYNAKKAVCGWGHSVVLTETGEVIVFGRPSDFKTLMRISSLNDNVGSWFAKAINNTYVKIDPQSKDVLCLFPTVLDGISSVKDICASAALTLALTDDGYVYAFGINQWGQCGLGTKTDYVLSPERVVNISNIKAIDCGFQHSLALSEFGEVYAWGKGERGQCGDGTTEKYQVYPIVVSFPGADYNSSSSNNGNDNANDDGSKTQSTKTTTTLSSSSSSSSKPNIIAISAGFAHSSALDDEGGIWLWGKAMSTEVKDKDAGGPIKYEDQLSPRKVNLPNQLKAIEICSNHFTVLVRAEDGTLWTLGMGEYDRNRIPDFIPVHDVYTKEELEDPSKEARNAIISQDVVIKKGYNRINLLQPNAPPLQVILHEKEAFLQPFGLEVPKESFITGVTNLISDLLKGQMRISYESEVNLDPIFTHENYSINDLSVGWRHQLAIVEEKKG